MVCQRPELQAQQVQLMTVTWRPVAIKPCHASRILSGNSMSIERFVPLG